MRQQVESPSERVPKPGKVWVLAVWAVISVMISLGVLVMLKYMESRTLGTLVSVDAILQQDVQLGERVLVAGQVSEMLNHELLTLRGAGRNSAQELLVLLPESSEDSVIKPLPSAEDVILVQGLVYATEELLTLLSADSSEMLRVHPGKRVLQAEQVVVTRAASGAAEILE